MHNHHTPVFSIITVTYNADKVLEDTILSVISQSYQQVEYIVIDGDSKDNTHSLIEKYRDKIHILVSEPDKGIYDAMNKGIKLATGDYLCFLNAGDTFHENSSLQQIVEGLNKKNNELPDIIYGETALVDAHRNFIRMRRLSTPEKLRWKSFKKGMLVCHQAFIAKRSLAEPYDMNYRFSSDFDWCIRTMKKASMTYNTHQTLIDYLEEGMTTQNRQASLKERFRIMAHHYGFISTLAYHAWFIIRLLSKPGQ